MLEMEKDLEATSAPPSEFQQSQEFNDKPEEVISEEVRARIEKNRKDARAKLLAKYQSNQEIQGSPVQRPPKKRKRTGKIPYQTSFPIFSNLQYAYSVTLQYYMI